MSFELKATGSEARLLALVGAVCVYALAGSPTPDRPGLVEALVAILLLVAAGGWRIITVFQKEGVWQRQGLLLLIYGFSVPLVGSLVNGASPVLAIRDLIAFLFLLLPLFVTSTEQRGFVVPVTIAVSGAGIIFSLRSLLVLWCQTGGIEFYCTLAAQPASYLANAPTVLFSALLCLGLAGKRLYEGIGARNWIHASVLGLLAVIPLAAMALAMQRASLAFTVMALAVLFILGLIRRPKRVLFPLLVAGILLWLGSSFFWDLFIDLQEKSALVGLNMRWQEAAAVFYAISKSSWAVLFGLGWGAELSSPAVGGLSVNFTHSLVTTYLLKTGLFGLLLVGAYLMALGSRLIVILAHSPVIAMAIAAPFFIDIFLYASFKSLDFGLILLLIPLWADRARSLQIRHGYSSS